MNNLFRKIANRISTWTGSAWAFLIAFSIVFVWALTGPIFDFSGTWQLFINTGTTIVTFLMVFLIQNTQNRDGKAMQLKLDELIRASSLASDHFLDLEDMTDSDLEELDQEFKRLRELYENNPPKSIHKLHVKISDARTKRSNQNKSS